MTTLSTPTAVLDRPDAPTRGDLSFPRIVASEWIRFRSLRSNLWVLLITVATMIFVSVLIGWAATTEEAGEQPTGTAASLVTSGISLGQLTVAVLGVLTITGEYTTGMIRSTMTAVPRRLPVLWARVVVLAAVVAVVSAIGVALSHLATIPFQSQVGVTLDLADGETLRILLGTSLFLASIAVFALAIGSLVRNSAGGLAIVLGILLVIENIFVVIPMTFFQNVGAFLPATAGGRLLMETETLAMVAETSTTPQLTPWQGYAVMLAWVVLALVAAAALLRRRDV